MRDVYGDRAFQAALRASLAVAAVAGSVYLAFRAWSIVEPLLVSIVLATALWPWVSRISRTPFGPRHWRLPRIASTALIYVVTFSAASLAIWWIMSASLPRVDPLLDRFPEQTAVIRAYLQPFRSGDVAGGAAKVAAGVAQEAASPAAVPAGAIPVDVGALTLGLFGGLTTLVLVLVFTFFLLLEGGYLAQSAILALPREHREHVRLLGIRVRDRVSRWVLAQVAYSLISAATVGLGMWALQIPSPWLYSVAAALLAAVPGVGPAVVSIPAFVVALQLSTWQSIAVVLFGLLLYLFDNTLIGTKVYAGMLRLPTFVVLLSLLLGGALMGVWGALIGPPVAAALLVTVRDRLGRDDAA